MRRRIISLISTIAILLSFGVVASANQFSDVTKENLAWAYDQIDEMASKGVINGFPGGKFEPNNSVTKIDSMLLIARILGYNDAVYKTYIPQIVALYEKDLVGLSITYPKEVSFLIFKGAFTVDEVKKLSQNNEFQKPLLRHEAAEFLTRAMGQYEYVSGRGSSDTGYVDEAEIPSSARKFVKYVKEQGIMLGMTATTFNPLVQVNRAQMAVMLHRVMKNQNQLAFDGSIASVDTGKNELKAKIDNERPTYDITKTKFVLNGEIVAPKDVKLEAPVVFVFHGQALYAVEAFYEVPKVASSVKGEVKEVVFTSTKTISIRNSDTYKVEEYVANGDCEVYVGTSKHTLSVVRMKDFAELKLDKEGVVVRVDILDKTSEFNDGMIVETSIKDDYKMIVERDNKQKETYRVLEDVVVKRNSKEVTLRDVLVGDEISKVVLDYGRVSRIEVKSDVKTSKGLISEIIISDSPKIVVDTSGIKTKYDISSNIEIYVDGQLGDLYSLRYNMPISITTDSSAITRIDVNSVAEVNQVTGKVETINSAYGFVSLKISGGEEKQVFISKGAKITDDASGLSKTIKDIKVGDTLVVVGKLKNGAFEATTVVIVKQ